MFYFDEFVGKKVLKSSLLSDVDCFFTTREFVLTPSNREDLEEISDINRKILLEAFNVNNIVTAVQTHSANVQIINSGKFLYDDTDSLISNIKNSVLMLNFADCVPIILYSKKDNIGAVIHAGWRGTVAEILKKTVHKMNNILNVDSSDIIALIGPSIGKCCFETDYEVFSKLVRKTNDLLLFEQKNDKYFVDLKLLNYNQLREVDVQNIDICSYCTCCMSDIFFSYRKEKGITARHSAIIKI